MKYFSKKSGTLLIISACAVLLTVIFKAAANAQLVEQVYSRGIYPVIAGVLSFLTGWLPFSLGELMVYAGVLTVCMVPVLLVVWSIRRRWQSLVSLGCVLVSICFALYWGFYVTWGLNYFRQPLAVSLNIAEPRYDASALYELCVALREDAITNQCEMPQTWEILSEIPKMMENLKTIDDVFISVDTPKRVLFSKGLSNLQITGIYFPYTAEANVNIHQPRLMLAAVAAHESAHRMGIAREDEANFTGYLACANWSKAWAKYSGDMFALMYCASALDDADPKLCARLVEGYSERMRRDFCSYNLYWLGYDTGASKIMESINNGYLAANGQAEGIKSYGSMIALMLGAYQQGIILQ